MFFNKSQKPRERSKWLPMKTTQARENLAGSAKRMPLVKKVCSLFKVKHDPMFTFCWRSVGYSGPHTLNVLDVQLLARAFGGQLMAWKTREI